MQTGWLTGAVVGHYLSYLAVAGLDTWCMGRQRLTRYGVRVGNPQLYSLQCHRVVIIAVVGEQWWHCGLWRKPPEAAPASTLSPRHTSLGHTDDLLVGYLLNGICLYPQAQRHKPLCCAVFLSRRQFHERDRAPSRSTPSPPNRLRLPCRPCLIFTIPSPLKMHQSRVSLCPVREIDTCSS